MTIVLIVNALNVPLKITYDLLFLFASMIELQDRLNHQNMIQHSILLTIPFQFLPTLLDMLKQRPRSAVLGHNPETELSLITKFN